VFLACLDVISFDTLHQHFSEMPEYKLAAMLHTIEKNGIVFKEDEYYLSLPLSINKITGGSKRLEETTDLILHE